MCAVHRFIVRAALLAGDAVTLDGAHARQIAVVLRMKPGDEITLVAGLVTGDADRRGGGAEHLV